MDRAPCFAGTSWGTDIAQQSHTLVTLKDRWQYDEIIITPWKFISWWDFILSPRHDENMYFLIGWRTRMSGEGQSMYAMLNTFHLKLLINFHTSKSWCLPWKMDLCGVHRKLLSLSADKSSRDPRQKVRTTVMLTCLFPWLFSCKFTLNHQWFTLK